MAQRTKDTTTPGHDGKQNKRRLGYRAIRAAVGELIESGATVMGRGLAAGVEGMAQLTERAAQMTGMTSPRAAGKTAESAARTTMTAARSAARTAGRATQRAARSTATRGKAAGPAVPCVQRSARSGRKRATKKRHAEARAEARRAESVDAEGAPESVSIEINAVQADRREERPEPEALVTAHLSVRLAYRLHCHKVWSLVHGTGCVKCGPRDLGRFNIRSKSARAGTPAL